MRRYFGLAIAAGAAVFVIASTPKEPVAPSFPIHNTVRAQWALDAIVDQYAARLGIPAERSRQIVAAVDLYAPPYNIDPWLVLGIITIESSGDPLAVSHKGAVGLMQIMPGTGRFIAEDLLDEEWKGVDSLYEMGTNIRYGIAYYRQLLDRFGDTKMALAAYNFGPTNIQGRVEKGTKIPKTYAEKVLRAAYGDYPPKEAK